MANGTSTDIFTGIRCNRMAERIRTAILQLQQVNKHINKWYILFLCSEMSPISMRRPIIDRKHFHYDCAVDLRNVKSQSR